MHPFNTHKTRAFLQKATGALGVLCLGLVVYGFSQEDPTPLQGRLLPRHMRHQTEWVTLSADDIRTGTTVPQDKNVVIHLPEEIERITRKVLFGRRGDTIRYWGYCFPHNLDEAAYNRRNGFPGELFLSEAEREARRHKMITERRRTFSVFKNLTDADLNETQRGPKARIRHQKEVFTGGTSCFVMTQRPIPIGTDEDGDGLNSAEERNHRSDPNIQDSDSDGIHDGLEVYRMGSNPIISDTDGDGIPDGIEDANRNGKFDSGETNPTEWDTDRDGLCDGLCKVNKGQDLRGEDKNRNGLYEPDKNEYNPRTVDSDGDGVLDEHEVYLCVLAGGDDC